MTEIPGVGPPRIAHLLRPAAGGMRGHVRALLLAHGGMLAAPPEALAALADAVPDPSDRYALSVAASDPAALLGGGAAAGRWARAGGAALLHGHGLRLAPLFAAAARAGGLPLVITLHNLVPARLSLPARVVLCAALGAARRVIAVSEAVARSARPVLGDARLVVIPNGVDLARFAPGALPGRAPARRSLGLDDDAAVVLCLARLSPEKDVGNFLEAAALVAPRIDARFLVAGDGPLMPTLRTQIVLLGLEGRATLLGRREDVPALLAASDLFCLPSREEGLSLAALEAMAAGLPVAATDVGGMGEAVEHGATGLLVPPRDPAALSIALRDLLADPARAQTMGAAGRARAESHFTLSGMLEATRALYREAAR